MTPLIPRDPSFFVLFAEMSDNLIAAARAMVDLFVDFQDVESKVAQIRRIEHRGDELTHNILTRLSSTFITPFDREDIHALASSLDDILDFLNEAATRITMYKITNPPPAAVDISRLILLQCQEIQKALSLIQKNGDILTHCIEVNRLEDEADHVSRAAIAQLFDQETNPINLIKTKELLELLETATDRAEDVANVLETVLLKNT